MYTRVLLGNISLEMLKMPKSFTGAQIDAVARQHLWTIKKDYGHGTGHGVGHFLNVHEGPHSISPKCKVNFEEGMVVTNEPGYYEAGSFGIRIENILIVNKENQTNFKFENITKVPYCKNLFHLKLLSDEIKEHINNYHEQVWNEVSSNLEVLKDEKAFEFLYKSTQKI